jgi:hypothetical protein
LDSGYSLLRTTESTAVTIMPVSDRDIRAIEYCRHDSDS